MTQRDDADSPWINLTPECGVDGRVLSVDERIAHAAAALADINRHRLIEFAMSLDADLSAEHRKTILEAVEERQDSAAGAMLARITRMMRAEVIDVDGRVH